MWWVGGPCDGYLRLLHSSKAGFAVVYIYRSFFSMVAGIGSLIYEQRLFLVPAFRGQLVPIVQAWHVGLENYEVFSFKHKLHLPVAGE